jgi:hypothetical protein
MKRKNSLALIIAYYLSRFDREAYQNLGFETLTGGHETIGNRLDVNPNTVKNMRDEFDSIHDNPRVGWYQREIRPSRQQVVDAFQGLGEFEIRGIVQQILETGSEGDFEGLEQIINDLTEGTDDTEDATTQYIVRGPTGRAAEEFFMEDHRRSALPRPGELIDTRDEGCGYDFMILSEDKNTYIEVKGLKTVLGGMLFTAKEWEMAMQFGEDYFVALVRDLENDARLELIQNPAAVFRPDKSIRSIVQVRYQVGKEAVRAYLQD